MKTKIFLCASLLLGLSLASCSDDEDFNISTDPVVDESSVGTGSSDVTANSATLHGTVKGLDNKSASFYSVGFYYGDAADNMPSKVDGTLSDGVVSASVEGLETGRTYYYQTYVTLKGQVTFFGEVKSFVTTNATITTSAAQAVDFCSAAMGGTATEAPANSTVGVVIASVPDVEKVRAGLIVPASEQASSFTVNRGGFVPSTTYYYAAYLDLGSGIIYGEVEQFTTSSQNYNVDDELVDLGLSVKWAKSNIGAKSETDFGGLFGFGDLTGVNNSYDPADYASADIYKTTQDLVWNATGGKATLPSYQDYEELFAKCDAEWTSVDGVAGYKLTGPNGNSIFLPAAGSRSANDITGEGTTGYYATGSINANDPNYCVAYQFSSSNRARTLIPVYQAAAVRAISTARNVQIDKSILCKTWEIDYNAGKTVSFNGPVWFYGTADSWKNITNNETVLGDSWKWDADASNTWAFGDCSGYMTFTEDGKVTVKNQGGEEVEGTYTIDYDNYTITSTVDLLAPDNFVSPMVENRKNEIKILSLTESTLQLGYYRDSDPATLSVNMIPQDNKYGIPVDLICVGGDWNGTWGSEIGLVMPLELSGSHTFHYDGSCSSAMVFTLDFAEFNAKYPDYIITITDIRCDGQSIAFDADKFFYGNIENNGNYRIELFNIYGKGATDGAVRESPFSSATNAGNDPAFTFSANLEFDCYITESPSFTPGLITINPSWGGDWTGPNDGSFSVIVDSNNKLVPSKTDFDITLNAADYGTDYSAGSIMTFVNTPDLMNMFPGTKMTLTYLALDGTEVTGWDAGKVPNSSDGNQHRLELWNCYGITGADNADNCAFGKRDGDVMKALGFNTSMRVKFSIDSLF